MKGSEAGRMRRAARGVRNEPSDKAAFLIDVDDTLIDNDRIERDLNSRLEETLCRCGRKRHWTVFEAVRAENRFVDYAGASERYRLEDTH